MGKWITNWNDKDSFNKEDGTVLGGFLYRSTENNNTYIPFTPNVASNHFNKLDYSEFSDKIETISNKSINDIAWQRVV